MEINGKSIILDAGEEITVKARESEPKPQPEPTPEPTGKLLYKVGLISDVHMDVEDSHNSEYMTDLQNALEYFRKNGVEFICCCGDFCEYNDRDYEVFYDWYNAHGWAATYGELRLLAPMGNHDYEQIYHKRNEVPAGYASAEMIWQQNISPFHEPETDIHFFEYGAAWNAPKKTGNRTIKSKLNYWQEIHGAIYVFVSVDYGMSDGKPFDDVIRGFNLLDYNDPYVQRMMQYASDTDYDGSREAKYDYQFYNPESLCWLRDIIENNTDKRIFLFMHHFLPNKAGDTNGTYSHLRIWPYQTSEAAQNKYYAGSNTVCGLTFHYLDKLLHLNRHVVCFGGHSHYGWKEQEDLITRQYKVKLPTGNEVMPLVDDLNTLDGTEYDYHLYTPVGHSYDDCAPTVHVPSLSKPVNGDGRTEYGASQGGVMEVYDDGSVVIRCLAFKREGESGYCNEVIKTINI